MRAILCVCLVTYTRCLAIAYGPLGCAQSQWRICRGCKVQQRTCRATYDPSHDRLLDDHCCFATYAYGMGALPTQSTVFSLRRSLRRLWELHPQRLQQVAAAEGLTGDQYLQSIEEKQWGGISDLMLLTYAAGRELIVRDSRGARLAALQALKSARTVAVGFGGQVRRIDRSIERLSRAQRDGGPQEDVLTGHHDPKVESRGGMPSVGKEQIEEEVQKRTQFLSEHPELAQRQGAHHRCTLCSHSSPCSHAAA